MIKGNTMNKLMKYIKRVNGQSLAEFAVTTAMMATLATTAAPKFSGVGEGAKEKKTLADVDKILKSANNFYNAKVTSDGRGRFPGQDKYNEKVGGHASNQEILDDIQNVYDDVTGDITDPADFISFDGDDGYDWVSVFGVSNYDFPKPDNAQLRWDDEDEIDPCNTCPEALTAGRLEWLKLFGGSAVGSPFQDGHYVYQVVAGSGAGTRADAPILYLADIENPRDFHIIFQP